MLKDLLVPMMLGRNERDAARVACALARRHEAHVDVLIGLTWASPIVAGWEYFPAGMYDTLNETTRAAADSLAAEVRPFLADEAVKSEIRMGASFWSTPAEQTLPQAYATDLVVLGRGKAVQEAESRLFASLLLGAGRPVLVVPPSRDRRAEFKHVVIAWKPTREAARAVHDAMPLLRAAETIDILMAAGPGEHKSQIEETGAALSRHLAVHGLGANRRRLLNGDHAVGDGILEFAKANGADLIVAGGYGHARAIEQVFGGVTRALFEHSPIPVLFSH